jgi:hypothetical protein
MRVNVHFRGNSTVNGQGGCEIVISAPGVRESSGGE